MEFAPLVVRILGATFGFLTAVLAGYYWYVHYGVVRAVSKARRVEAGSLDAPGMVALAGRVDAVDPLANAVTDGVDDAAVLGWRVDRYRDPVGSMASWRVEGIGVDGAAFALDDDTGRVRVEPPSVGTGWVPDVARLLSIRVPGLYVDGVRAEFAGFGGASRLGAEDPLPASVRERMAGGLLASVIDPGRPDARRRYYEGLVRDGDECLVVGHAHPVDDAGAGDGGDGGSGTDDGGTASRDLVVGPHPDGDAPFVVSAFDEGRVVAGARRRARVAGAIALLGLAALALSVAI